MACSRRFDAIAAVDVVVVVAAVDVGVVAGLFVDSLRLPLLLLLLWSSLCSCCPHP